MIKNNKTTFFCFIFLAMLLVNCSKNDNIGQFDDAVVESETNYNKFKQITFTLNIANSLNEYVNVNLIDSVTLKVNGKEWGTFKSEIIDTSYKTNRIHDDLMFSNTKINYLIIAPYKLKTDKLETAGDFVDYLSDRIILTPGDYVCEVSEIKFQNLKKQWVSIKPQIYKDFTVIPNTTSSFAGEITITIK